MFILLISFHQTGKCLKHTIAYPLSFSNFSSVLSTFFWIVFTFSTILLQFFTLFLIWLSPLLYYRTLSPFSLFYHFFCFTLLLYFSLQILRQLLTALSLNSLHFLTLLSQLSHSDFLSHFLLHFNFSLNYLSPRLPFSHGFVDLQQETKHKSGFKEATTSSDLIFPCQVAVWFQRQIFAFERWE